MKGYKGFEKGLICRDKQYKENTIFEEAETEICEKGMHFCENPLDVLNYYPLVDENGNLNEFAEVEALGDVEKENDKCCTNKLKIGAKISFKKLIEANVKVVLEKTCKDGDYAQIESSGYCAKIGSSGYYAQIGSSGDSAVIMCAGKSSIVKAKKGSWITLAEYNDDEEVVCVKTEYVDGERIKEDTFYKLENGEFKEC